TTLDEVKVWGTASRKLEGAVRETHQDWPSLVISPDGKWLVTAHNVFGTTTSPGSNRVHVWDLAEREPKFQLLPEAQQPMRPTFSPNGALLAIGSEDGLVSLWKTALWDATESD